MGITPTISSQYLTSSYYSRSPPTTMAEAKFIGKWVPESKDGYDAFMKGVGMTDEQIEKNRNVVVVTEISQDGDAFVITRIRPDKTLTNRLQLGKECEVETLLGQKMKVTCTLSGNSVTGESANYKSVMTVMDDGKLKEEVTVKGNTITVVSKKQ